MGCRVTDNESLAAVIEYQAEDIRRLDDTVKRILRKTRALKRQIRDLDMVIVQLAQKPNYFIQSTPKSPHGKFYDACKRAEKEQARKGSRHTNPKYRKCKCHETEAERAERIHGRYIPPGTRLEDM